LLLEVTDMDDPFDNLDNLRLTSELMALNPPASPAAKPKRRSRTRGKFYHVSQTWLDRAYAACRSKAQLMIGIRLFRNWRLRKPGEQVIIASNLSLAGPGFSREIKRRALENLWAANLIDVRSVGNGRAARVVVLE
jgi:hypothetical protein